MMGPFWKFGRAAVCALTVLSAPLSSYAQSTLPLTYDQEQALRTPNGSEMFVDALIARPLGLFAMGLGAVTYVLTLPVTLPSHSVDAAGKELVVAPTKYTFKRPLGRFVSCEDQPDFCK